MLDEIRSMGFNRVELGHGLRLSLLEGVDRVHRNDRDLQIASLHSVCPLPVDCIGGVPPQRVHCICCVPGLAPTPGWYSVIAQDMAPHMQCTTVLRMPGMGVGAEHWQAGADITPWASALRCGSRAKAARAQPAAAVASSRRRGERKRAGRDMGLS